MKLFFRRFLLWALCVCTLVGFCVSAAADEEKAKDISDDVTISCTGYEDLAFLTNGDLTDYVKSTGSCTMKIKSSEANISSLYLLFNLEYGEYVITNEATGATFTAGTNDFLHEYIDLAEAFGGPVQSISIRFGNGIVRLSEVCCFTQGQTPDFVQKWERPLDSGADIMLLSTHGDDEQLFFAGLFPLYAAERDYQVQVVYFTNHRTNTYKRTHEMLNGMWATGVKYYPVFGEFEDFLRETMSATYAEYEALGRTKEEMLGFVVEQLRRFKPQVVIGHDFKGEYSHGMHMVYTDLLVQALDITNDPTAYPELADKYGLWDVPKTYIHLYNKNPIVIDYDVPLESFDGMTAFEVTQKIGYPCHESQQFTWFTKWINGKNVKITKATQIKTYNPCHFGLYRSTVGEDVLKNDFMENITPYAELHRIEAERLEQERLEQERLEQERLEQERIEQERLEKERLEQERIEQERLEKERLEQEKLEQERREKERIKQEQLAAQRKKQLKGLLLIITMILCLVVAVLLLIPKKRRRKKRGGKYSKKR